VALIV
jgi:hypothetical protein